MKGFGDAGGTVEGGGNNSCGGGELGFTAGQPASQAQAVTHPAPLPAGGYTPDYILNPQDFQVSARPWEVGGNGHTNSGMFGIMAPPLFPRP